MLATTTVDIGNASPEKMRFKGRPGLRRIIDSINLEILTLLGGALGGAYFLGANKENLDVPTLASSAFVLALISFILSKKYRENERFSDIFKDYISARVQDYYYFDLDNMQILDHNNKLVPSEHVSCESSEMICCSCSFKDHGCIFKKLGQTEICPAKISNLFREKLPPSWESEFLENFPGYKSISVTKGSDGYLLSFEIEIGFLDSGGDEQSYRIAFTPSKDSEGAVSGISVDIKDILAFKVMSAKRNEEQKKVLADATTKAEIDALTGLHNRMAFLDLVSERLGSNSICMDSSSYVGILFFDLDDFKPVNDTYGHDVGDEVLKIVAQRIKAVLRGTDLVGRSGTENEPNPEKEIGENLIGRFAGDEFFVFVDNVKKEEDLERIIKKIKDAISQPILLGVNGRDIFIEVGASVGCSCQKRNDGLNLEEMIRTADYEMYVDKERTKLLNYLASNQISSVQIVDSGVGTFSVTLSNGTKYSPTKLNINDYIDLFRERGISIHKQSDN